MGITKIDRIVIAVHGDARIEHALEAVGISGHYRSIKNDDGWRLRDGVFLRCRQLDRCVINNDDVEDPSVRQAADACVAAIAVNYRLTGLESVVITEVDGIIRTAHRD